MNSRHTVRARYRGPVIICLFAFMLAALGLLGIWQCAAACVSSLQAGTAAYNARDWATAEKRAREWLKEHHDDSQAQCLLARSLFRDGRDQQAMGIYVRLAENMLEAEDYFLRGQALERMGQKEQAILIWRRALGQDLNHVETWVALEQIFFRLDLLSEAARGWAAWGSTGLGCSF